MRKLGDKINKKTDEVTVWFDNGAGHLFVRIPKKESQLSLPF